MTYQETKALSQETLVEKMLAIDERYRATLESEDCMDVLRLMKSRIAVDFPAPSEITLAFEVSARKMLREWK